MNSGDVESMKTKAVPKTAQEFLESTGPGLLTAEQLREYRKLLLKEANPHILQTMWPVTEALGSTTESVET